MEQKGTQVCIDMVGCSELLLNDITFIEKTISNAIKASGLTPIDKIKLHKFDPQGITGYALLSTSHIAIHTWPEFKYASIDVFACDKKEKVMAAVDVLMKALKPAKTKQNIFTRGYIIK
jgi:S-adenosylmethionine decarboxylase